VFKVLLIGSSGVGKSSILERFTRDKFDDRFQATVGVDFCSKLVAQGETISKLTLWDTAGQERFRTLTPSYYRGAHAVVLVFDVTSRESFGALTTTWVTELNLHVDTSKCIVVVMGNKMDCVGDRQVSFDEGNAYARENGFKYHEVSAKKSIGVQYAFSELADEVALQIPCGKVEEAHITSFSVDQVFSPRQTQCTV
jgi:Ras-related protein Rab-18